jgi:predicted O-methyltransferase YrrM
MINEKRREELKEFRERLGDFPIIRPKTASLIEKIVDKLNPNMVLELGSGRGFSSVVILSSSEKSNLLAVERDKDNFQELLFALGDFDFYDRALPVNADAEDITTSLVNAKTVQKFDLIFVDCNKSSYNRMYDKLITLLNDGGVLIADDVLYHGKVEGEPEIPEKKHRTIVVNMREFIDKAQKDNRLENVTLYDFEDGVLVATKKTVEHTNQ